MEVQTYGERSVQDSDLIQGQGVGLTQAEVRKETGAFCFRLFLLVRVWRGWRTHEVALKRDPPMVIVKRPDELTAFHRFYGRRESP